MKASGSLITVSTAWHVAVSFTVCGLYVPLRRLMVQGVMVIKTHSNSRTGAFARMGSGEANRILFVTTIVNRIFIVYSSLQLHGRKSADCHMWYERIHYVALFAVICYARYICGSRQS